MKIRVVPVLLCVGLILIGPASVPAETDCSGSNGYDSAPLSWVYSFYTNRISRFSGEFFETVIATDDGGLLFGTLGGLVKMTHDGVPLWSKQYYSGDFVVLNTHEHDGYFAVGNFGNVVTDWVVAKRVSLDGTQLWRKELRLRKSASVTAGIATADGAYLIAASSYNAVTRSSPLWLIKMSAQGTIIWQKEYNVAYAGSLNELPGGDILVSTWGFSLLRLSGAGQIRWQRKYSDGAACCQVGIHRVTSTGDIVMAGNRSDALGGIQVVKMNISGKIQWTRIYRPITQIADIRVSTDGGFYLLGQGPEDYPDRSWLIRLDSTGNILWSRSFGNGKKALPPAALLITEDGVVICTESKWVIKVSLAGAVNSCRPISQPRKVTMTIGTLSAQRLFPKSTVANGNVRVTPIPPILTQTIRSSICP